MGYGEAIFIPGANATFMSYGVDVQRRERLPFLRFASVHGIYYYRVGGMRLKILCSDNITQYPLSYLETPVITLI